MNFALCLIITITTLSKILGAFNTVFSYTGICLRSLVMRVGIIYHHPVHSTHKPPLLMSAHACLSVAYVNPWVEFLRGGSALSVGVSVCVIYPYKRGSIVFTTVLSNLSKNQWLLCVWLLHFFYCFVIQKWAYCFVLFRFLFSRLDKPCYSSCLKQESLQY